MAFSAVVHNSHLVFNGVRYFRGHAESVVIGSYGEKRTPLTQQNYLEVQSDLPADRLKVNTVTIADIDFSRSRDADLKIGLKAADTGASGSVALSDLKTGKLKLVKLEMRLLDLKTVVNGLSAVLGNLRSYGNDARVAHQIFVVLEATLAQTFAASGDISFTRTGSALKMSADASASASGSTTITLSSGTTFAYLLANPDWDRGKNRIEKFTDDQHGIT